MRFLLALLPSLLLTAPAFSQDAALLTAQTWQGRALILRTFPAANNLAYDAAGHLQKPGKVVDWTLAGMNLEQVTRRPDGALELVGPRVAILYKPGQHQFERHALKLETIKILLPTQGSAAEVGQALATIFSVGIDPALQRSMPPCWSHYFIPSLPWPDDSQPGSQPGSQPDKDILRANAKLPEATIFPVVEKKTEPAYTDPARTDKIKGTVSLIVVVDATGTPLRVTVRQPLGYGLDAHAAEAIAHWRFQPGTVNGVPTAMEVLVNQAFDLIAP